MGQVHREIDLRHIDKDGRELLIGQQALVKQVDKVLDSGAVVEVRLVSRFGHRPILTRLSVDDAIVRAK